MANRLPLIRYSMTRPFVDAIIRARVDPEPILWANKLDPDKLNDDDAFVPTQRWYDFTEAAADELENPYLGYQVGAHSVLSSLPHMRVLQFPNATLGELLTTLVINSARMGTSARYDLKTDGRWTELTTRRTFRPSKPPAQIDAFFLGFMVQLLRACTGDAWNINDVMTTVCDRSAVPPGEVPR
ncbi:MAG: AraC family transcriptional regulator, partial [bacterium]|nr:AraC family transcriptional regulator [bacterium]